MDVLCGAMGSEGHCIGGSLGESTLKYRGEGVLWESAFFFAIPDKLQPSIIPTSYTARGPFEIVNSFYINQHPLRGTSPRYFPFDKWLTTCHINCQVVKFQFAVRRADR